MPLLRRLMGYKNDRLSCRQPDSGQSTVEFALVVVGFMAVVVGLATLWHYVADGRMLFHVQATLSHGVPQALFELLQF